jgi:hypothetical protein
MRFFIWHSFCIYGTMEFNFSSFVEFLLDKSKTINTKFALLILGILLIFAFDYCTQLTYNNHVNNKLSQMVQVYDLKTKYANDSIVFPKLNALEYQILQQTHYTQAFNFIKKMQEINQFAMFVTASFGFLAVALYTFYIAFFTGAFDKNVVLGCSVAMVILFVFSYLAYALASLVPYLGNPYYHYTLNATVQGAILFWYLRYYVVKRAQ